MPSVEIRGNTDLRKALRRFAPDLDKALTKELRAALNPVVKQARGFVPATEEIMRGWRPRSFSEARFPFYDASLIKSGITYSTSVSKPNKNGFTSNARIINKNAAGAIYETMGRKTPSSRFVQNQNGKYASQMKGKDKMEGRALFRAYEENNGKAREAVLKAISTAADKLNARAKV